MSTLDSVPGIGQKTLAVLRSAGITSVSELMEMKHMDGKNIGINNIKTLQNNAKTTVAAGTDGAEKVPVSSAGNSGVVVMFKDHSWFNKRVQVPIIMEKDDGKFSTVFWSVVVKDLAVENGAVVSFKVEYGRGKDIISSSVTYSPAFIASLNRQLPLLNVRVNKTQCTIFLVLKAVWEANVLLTMVQRSVLH